MRAASNTVLVFYAFLFLAHGAMQAETVFWSDNFETNAGSRWTTNTVWQIGSPVAGPAVNSSGFRTYTDSHCAVTGLKGAATSSMDSRLICTNYNGSNYLTIPPANQSPRLRFWQWYDFVNSGGVVEIQQAGATNWLAISVTNASDIATEKTGGGIWSRPSLDLSAFAGQNVQIAFHFESGLNAGTDPGWYVDDVALVTAQPVFNNPEGFEAGLGDWAVASGTWEVGVPTNGPAKNSNGFRAHSGTNCAATVLSGNYGWNADTRLVSAPLSVPTTGAQLLRFCQWYSFINAGGVIEASTGIATTNFISVTNVITSTNFVISTNITVTITNFVTVTNTTYVTNPFITNISTNVTTTPIPGANNWQAISPVYASSGGTPATSNGQWTTNTIDLSQFAGETIQLAFHFESGKSGYGNASGWYVDDLSLVQGPTLSLLSSITITNGQTFTLTALATNTTIPNAQYTFALGAVSTNAFITTSGLLHWTNTQTAIGTSILSVHVTDNNQPPFSVTNSLAVNVLPVYNFSASNTLSGKKYFLLSLQSLSNTTWRIDASTDLLNWQPVLTNPVPVGGYLLFTDRLATNFPVRFYRAVYP